MADSTSPMVRQPRGLVRVNGQSFDAWVSFEVESNSFYRADTFRASLALSALPDGFGPDWFATQKDLEVELFAGFPPDADTFTATDLTSLFLGIADEVVTHWHNGLIELNGRDLTAPMIDSKSSEKFTDRKASDVATLLAGRHGLTPVVTATTETVGRFYKSEHIQLQDDRSEWDLLTFLAKEENFVVYVRGRELHFEPAPDETASPYVLEVMDGVGDRTVAGDFISLTTTRELTLAKDIKVTVKSWNAKQKKGFVRSAFRKKAGGKNVQEYTYIIGGLTDEQAQARANAILADLSRHEVKLEFEAPGDLTLTVPTPIQLKGTPLDQIFYPDTVRRTMDRDQGFRMTVEAKNHSPESEPNL